MTTDNKTMAVDVLAVLRQIADGEGDAQVLAMRACAAVAELIEAGAAYAEIMASSDNWTGDEQRYFAQMAGAEPDSSRWVVIQTAQSRFEAALARVKGE